MLGFRGWGFGFQGLGFTDSGISDINDKSNCKDNGNITWQLQHYLEFGA